MQRGYRLCGAMGLQALQIGGGSLQRLLGLLQALLGLVLRLRGLRSLLLPVLEGLQGGMARLQSGQGVLQLLGLGLQLRALGLGQQLHAARLRLIALQRLAGIAGALKHGLRYLAVDVGACQLFEQLGAFIGTGLQKRGKPALGQQHRFGKALKIQSGDLGHLAQLVAAVGAEDFSIGHARQFHLGALQRAAGLVAGAALAPEGTVDGALDLELHLGHAICGVARHQVVAAGAEGGQPGCLVVERQANCIEQGRFARARGAGDRKQAVVGKGRGCEIDAPLAFERVQVLEPQAAYLHGASPLGLESDCSTAW